MKTCCNDGNAASPQCSSVRDSVVNPPTQAEILFYA